MKLILLALLCLAPAGDPPGCFDCNLYIDVPEHEWQDWQLDATGMVGDWWMIHDPAGAGSTPWYGPEDCLAIAPVEVFGPFTGPMHVTFEAPYAAMVGRWQVLTEGVPVWGGHSPLQTSNSVLVP